MYRSVSRICDHHLGSRKKTILVLDAEVVEKLRRKSQGNVSEIANCILKKALLPKRRTMFGVLKGIVSTSDVVEAGQE